MRNILLLLLIVFLLYCFSSCESKVNNIKIDFMEWNQNTLQNVVSCCSFLEAKNHCTPFVKKMFRYRKALQDTILKNPDYKFVGETMLFEQYIEGNESRTYQVMIYSNKRQFKVSSNYLFDFKFEELNYAEDKDAFLSNPKCCKSDMEYYIRSASNPVIKCVSEFIPYGSELRIKSSVAY